LFVLVVARVWGGGPWSGSRWSARSGARTYDLDVDKVDHILIGRTARILACQVMVPPDRWNVG
jgi:hypothetical protein